MSGQNEVLFAFVSYYSIFVGIGYVAKWYIRGNVHTPNKTYIVDFVSIISLYACTIANILIYR